jgi:hypothetical protein
MIQTTAAAVVDPGIAQWLGFSPQQWTLGGLVFVIVMMVLTGYLKPWPQVKAQIKDIRDDRDEWKAEAKTNADTARMLADAARENAEPAKTVAKFIRSAQHELGVTDETPILDEEGHRG